MENFLPQTVKNLNNFNNVAMPNTNRCSIHESHSSHHEYPKVKNMENVELMSLEKELQSLQEKSNFGKYHEQRFSEQLLRFFKRNHSHNTLNDRK
jgi:D-hexose-6-phosphate mutarotase